jgi:hypothetical protein
VAGGRGHIYLMKPDGSDYDQLSFGTTASFSTNGEDATVVATTNPPDNGIWVVGPAVGSWREAEFVRGDPDGDRLC